MVAANQFQAHLTVQLRIVGLVDGAHSALAEETDDPISFADHSAWGELERRVRRDGHVAYGDRPTAARREGFATQWQWRRAPLALRRGFRVFVVALGTNHLWSARLRVHSLCRLRREIQTLQRVRCVSRVSLRQQPTRSMAVAEESPLATD